MRMICIFITYQLPRDPMSDSWQKKSGESQKQWELLYLYWHHWCQYNHYKTLVKLRKWTTFCEKRRRPPGFWAEHLAISWESHPGTWEIVATMSGNSIFCAGRTSCPGAKTIEMDSVQRTQSAGGCEFCVGSRGQNSAGWLI